MVHDLVARQLYGIAKHFLKTFCSVEWWILVVGGGPDTQFSVKLIVERVLKYSKYTKAQQWLKLYKLKLLYDHVLCNI